MGRWLFALILPVSGLVGGWLWAAQAPAAPNAAPAKPGAPPAAAPAKPRVATQGELAILNSKGETVALCPLKHTAVTADVSGYVARVNVEQEFTNPSKEAVEAVYTFPLPDDAAVDDMTMRIADRVIRGQVKKRDEARAIYEAAKARGQAAALLDQERPNIFTQAVANLVPGATVKIAISYVNLLKYHEGGYEWALPMVVGPRYTPGGGYFAPGYRGAPSPQSRVDGDPGNRSVVTDADRISPPITPPGTRAGHDISVTVKLDAGLPLDDVTSPLHAVSVTREGPTRATVRLKEATTIPNKDFILKFDVAGERPQVGVLANAPEGKGGYFTLVLQPPAAPPQSEVSPKEMVFVIDQTGSQSGWPIKKAKETMRACIENLNPGDTFQLIGFNTQVFPCFEKPVPVSPENLKKAWDFLEPIEGNGGTDILKSVDFALKIPYDPARLRVVCYMTDGYVGNDMQILDYIRKHRGTTRMFPFGIGNSVNRFLIEGMAREGRGAAEYVTLDAQGAAAASRFHNRIAKPLLLDVKVEWNGLPVEDVYPRQLPDLFAAGPIILKGRYTRGAEGEVTVSGLLRGKPWSQKVRVSLPAVEKGGAAIPTLWAREKIEDLQTQDWLGAQTGNPNPKLQEQIVNLALDYRLMSQWTSFVAVEERIVNVGGVQRKIDVPVEMPEGVSYQGIFGPEQERLARRGAVTRFYAAPAQSVAGAAGAFGGSVRAGRVAPPPVAAPKPAGVPALGTVAPQAQLLRKEAKAERELRLDTAEGRKQLAEMKPEERRVVLEEVKLAEPLRGLAERLKKEGTNGSLRKPGLPEVEKGRVRVQVWVGDLPKDGLARLKALGFQLEATLTPNQLLLGTLPVAALEKLLELEFVRRVEMPRFLS